MSPRTHKSKIVNESLRDAFIKKEHVVTVFFDLEKGAFRTSPVASLYVEADEPSLYSGREKLSLQYAKRLAACPSNPAHEVTFPPNYVDLYEQKRKNY